MKQPSGRRWKMFFLLFVLVISGIFIVDYWVRTSTNKEMFSSVKNIPENKVGLLLGTSKYAAGNQINLYYQYRIDAAVELFRSGRVKFLLVSGDNGHEGYNEPELMKQDLMARGVPEDKIFLDYAGFRTYDSIIRCLKVFGEDHVTIISQGFHNHRALFIANHRGITAVAYNAKDVPGNYGLKTNMREKLARVKMVLDLVIGKQPKFTGPRISIS